MTLFSDPLALTSFDSCLSLVLATAEGLLDIIPVLNQELLSTLPPMDAPEPAKKTKSKSVNRLLTDDQISEMVDFYYSRRHESDGGNFTRSVHNAAATHLNTKFTLNLTFTQVKSQYTNVKTTYNAILYFQQAKSGAGGNASMLGSLEYTGADLEQFIKYVEGLPSAGNGQAKSGCNQYMGQRWPYFEKMHVIAERSSATGRFVHKPASARQQSANATPNTSHAPYTPHISRSTTAGPPAGPPTAASFSQSSPPALIVTSQSPVPSENLFSASSDNMAIDFNDDLSLTQDTTFHPPSIQSSAPSSGKGKRKLSARDDVDDLSIESHPSVKRSSSSNKATPPPTTGQVAVVSSMNSVSSSLGSMAAAIDSARMVSSGNRVDMTTEIVEKSNLSDEEKAVIHTYCAQNPNVTLTLPSLPAQRREAVLRRMLIYLIALTLLGISRSSPTTSSLTDIPATHQLVDTPSLFARDVSQCSKRTVAQIYWTCIGTIFACTWAALHPNLPGPRDSSFQQLRRRIVSMYIAIGAPELIVHWSLRQRVAAKRLKDEFNREFFNGEETPSGWTLTHGFFVQMGGFMLYDGKKPVRVLTFKRLVQAIKDQEIDLPDIPVEDIMDKSKRDTLGKFIVVVQTTWFIIQCIARSRSGLPLAELEISTLAFAVLNAIAYGILWSKPQSISVPIKLFLKHLPETLHPQHPQPDPSLSSPRTKVPHTPSVSALPLPLSKDTTQPRISDFNMSLVAISSGIGMVFGLLHLALWSFAFPTSTQRWVWNGSAFLITSEPVIALIAAAAMSSGTPGWIKGAGVLLFYTSGGIYIAARCALIFLSLYTVPNLPVDAYRDISWVNLFPHIF
ncbi:hypothetical protein AN958_07063 [Leucoagaricus sp. SymC.cos]|nr:hypothetical protein AN958_07063 [Leucoagaricus sp. SymC.cos]